MNFQINRFCEFGSSSNVNNYNNNNQIDQQQQHQQQTVAYWCNLGNEFHRQLRFEESLQCYRNAIAIDPHDCSLFFNIGDTYARLMQIDDAVRFLELSVSLSHFENMRYVSRLIDVFENSPAPSKYSQSIQSLCHQLATHVSLTQEDVLRQTHRLNRLVKIFNCSTINNNHNNNNFFFFEEYLSPNANTNNNNNNFINQAQSIQQPKQQLEHLNNLDFKQQSPKRKLSAISSEQIEIPFIEILKRQKC